MIYNKVYLKEISKFNQNNFNKSMKWNFVNYLDTGNLTENQIDVVQLIDLESDKLPSRARRIPSENSILYSTVRPNQKHYGFFENINIQNLLVSTGFVVIDVDRNKAVPKYIYYYLIQKPIINELQNIGETSTSAYPSVKVSDIENLEISLPSYSQQKAIANLLSSFDVKIENNNAIIANLEAQAQTIFKSWFVDFEPFQDLGFVESELGEIPVNWSIISLKEVSAITMGQSPKSENYNIEGMGYPFMQGNAAFGGKFGRIEKYTTKANKHAEVKDILLSVRAPVGDMNINIYPQLAIGRGLSSIRPNDNLYGYIYYYLNYYINKIIAKGTGTVFSSINKNDLEEFPILLPNTDIQLEKFNGLVETILDHQINLFKQNKKLAEIRDSLLPKLMSGEIRVGEVITEE